MTIKFQKTKYAVPMLDHNIVQADMQKQSTDFAQLFMRLDHQ